MTRNEHHDWMWSQAVAMLARAERLHDQMFEPQRSERAPSWAPPVDMIETDREVLILVAVPGVSPDSVETVIENGSLLIAGRRVLPRELRTAVIHRLELPQGRFERRIRLPSGVYSAVERAARDGCLLISLTKVLP